jgi:hypothetical protein
MAERVFTQPCCASRFPATRFASSNTIITDETNGRRIFCRDGSLRGRKHSLVFVTTDSARLDGDLK